MIMGFITIHRLNKFYESFRKVDVTFSSEVMSALNFKANKVFVRGAGGQWPCVFNSVSMMGAKIICSKGVDLYDKVRAKQQILNLRFAFEEERDVLAFFVTAKTVKVVDYPSKDNNLFLLTLEYTQRAPDDLIERLGLLLEANYNATKRRAERLPLDTKALHKINMLSRESFIFIKGIPRRCILLDVSFSGVKLIMVGVANFLLNSETTVKFDFEKPETKVGVKGKIVRAEQVEGRKDLVAIAVEFNSDEIPVIFKMHLNKYFAHLKPVADLDDDDEEEETPSFAPAEETVAQENTEAENIQATNTEAEPISASDADI